MADKNNNAKVWLLAAGGGLGLFFVGRALGRREQDDDELEFLLATCDDTPRADSAIAETAAHASSLSHQLYEISRRLREGSS